MDELPPGFDPLPILRALERHRVNYLVIGGIAALIRGGPFPTSDLDITPDRSMDNLDRLANALIELNAKIRIGASESIEFPIDGKMLSGNESWLLTTKHGQLDVMMVPKGTTGYDDLRRESTAEQIGSGLKVYVASLADVIRSKEAAGRQKDQMHLPGLRATLLEVTKRNQGR